MAEAAQVDRIDRNILRQLQVDAAITNAELAKRVNLSPAACLRRVEKLRASGLIARTVAVLDPSRIEMTTLVIVGVVLDRSTPASFGEFETAAKEHPRLPRVPSRRRRVRLFPRAQDQGHRALQPAARRPDHRAAGRPTDSDVLRAQGDTLDDRAAALSGLTPASASGRRARSRRRRPGSASASRDRRSGIRPCRSSSWPATSRR